MSSGAELLRRTLIGATQSPRKTEHNSRSRTKPESGVVARRQPKVGFCVFCLLNAPPARRMNLIIWLFYFLLRFICFSTDFSVQVVAGVLGW